MLGTTREDWRKWIEYVNGHYPVRWRVEDYNDDTPADAIDAEFMVRWWDAERTSASATIFLNKTRVQCYFFTETEIENDISPREFQSLQDHQQLVDYLTVVSTLLGKEVVVTRECYIEPSDAPVLLRVNGSAVRFS